MNSALPITIVDPRKLIPHESNPWVHPDRQKSAVRESLEEFGWIAPIVVSERSGRIIDGHERVEEAISLEWSGVPVRYVDVDETTELRMLAAINRTASLREENTSALTALLSTLRESEDGFAPGWEEADLEQRLKALAYEEDQERLQSEPASEEEGPSLEEIPARCAPGDLWALGPHRLLCGSATSAPDLLRVMGGDEADLLFTDPPYGVSATGGRTDTVRAKKIKAIENDALRDQELVAFLSSSLSLAPLKERGGFYVCYDAKCQGEMDAVLRAIGWTRRATIVWVKENFGLSGFKGYRPQHELIAFGHTGDDYAWYGDLGESDVWECARDRDRPGNHPTPKPVPLVKRALANSSRAGELVLDPFAGAGSTLIACEEMGRFARCIELDEAYCDVILRRWEQSTGGKAEKL